MPAPKERTGRRKSYEEIFQEFNKQSGLFGVSGVSNDSRDVSNEANKGNEDAKLALELWSRRIADFIGQYYVRLGGCDMIIFSAGIGENAPELRTIVLNKIKEALNVDIDWNKNDEARGVLEEISTPASKIKVYVIPTDEEVMIARDAYKLIKE